MYGKLIDVWPYSWETVWSELEEHEDSWNGLFTDLFVELEDAPNSLKERGRFDEIATTPMEARKVFQGQIPHHSDDRRIAKFLENAYEVLETEGSTSLAIRYAQLLEVFLVRYNLRYKLSQPFRLVPHLPGIFAGLVEEMTTRFKDDQHICELVDDYVHSLETLSSSKVSTDIKTCIHKACSKMEGILNAHPLARENTFAKNCKKVNTCPHEAISQFQERLYGFCSDYPGLRHPGNVKGKLRNLELRDAVILSIVMFCMSGYFVQDLDFENIIAFKEA